LVAEDAPDRGERQAGVDPKSVATIIIETLEGALMISRLERSDDARGPPATSVIATSIRKLRLPGPVSWADDRVLSSALALETAEDRTMTTIHFPTSNGI
jgi:hypothetical protein